MVARSGEPGTDERQVERGAEVDLDPVGLDADGVGEPRVAGVGAGVAEVGAHRRPGLGGGQRESLTGTPPW